MWVLFLLATWKLRIASWASASVRHLALNAVYIHSRICIMLKPASPVSVPHSRIAAVTVNKGRRVAICSRDMFTSEPFLHTII